MSNNFYYPGYERDVQEAKNADRLGFERCACYPSFVFICKQADCKFDGWFWQEREPIDKTQARQARGGWEIKYQHVHRCDCTSARRWWRIYDQQKEHRLGKTVEY